MNTKTVRLLGADGATSNTTAHCLKRARLGTQLQALSDRSKLVGRASIAYIDCMTERLVWDVAGIVDHMRGSVQMDERSRWPEELRLLKGRRSLRVRFDDGLEGELPAQLLRAFSQSAQVQGHGAVEKIDGAVDDTITVTNIERVGSYAVRLIFSDGHSTGYYTWAFLEDFIERLAERRSAFEEARAARRRRVEATQA
ncbi:MAG: DUF971 domain-containing protein [Pseudomonadota bacterium]